MFEICSWAEDQIWSSGRKNKISKISYNNLSLKRLDSQLIWGCTLSLTPQLLISNRAYQVRRGRRENRLPTYIQHIIMSMHHYIISSIMHAFWLVLIYDLLEDICIGGIHFVSLLYKTNRFHDAVHLFSSRSQKTSKCGKNISDTVGYRLACHFLFLPHFDIFCDLLLNRCMATWNLFVKYILNVWCVVFADYITRELNPIRGFYPTGS